MRTLIINNEGSLEKDSNNKEIIKKAEERDFKLMMLAEESFSISGISGNFKQAIHDFFYPEQRKANLKRRTSETDIYVELNLDGTGKSEIKTGLGFFDHLLEQISKHGNFDLILKAEGDLHVDEHHTIEDVAILLGETFLKALGGKEGIERYGFLLPMDDCLAQVAVDLGGRPWFVWDVQFKREKIGDVPLEMIKHFFKSFCDNAKCNLNIKAEGENDHHKAEAIFKAFAKAMKNAVRYSENYSIPSTKGKL